MNTSFLDCTSSCECAEAIHYNSFWNIFQGMDPNTRFEILGTPSPSPALQVAPTLVVSVSERLVHPSLHLFGRFPAALGSQTPFQSVEPHLKSIAISGATDMENRPV